MAAQRGPSVHPPFLPRDRQYLRQSLEPGSSMPLLATPLQTHVALDVGLFGDGPSHPRLAVVDPDHSTGMQRPGAVFVPRGVGPTVSCYKLPKLDADSAIEEFETDTFFQVSPFATVLKTLDFFEGPQLLGRRIAWAFGSPQLVLVPRAGEQQNAFYDRGAGSLQFFQHRHARDGHMVYTSLSHDIVVHEATHAILDGIAPDLYDATSPQSLAMHEAIADLSSITQTLLNEMVVWSMENISPANIEPPEALSRLAEEFGASRGDGFLRRLRNARTLEPTDDSTDEFGVRNRPDAWNLHALSEVLSGAVYAVFEKRLLATHRSARDGLPPTLDDVLCPAARRVARITFRALDYLPPGEASFADYGRAFLAAAAATYARPQQEQAWLREEFVRRRIVQSEVELELSPTTPLTGVDFATVVHDDEAARRFTEECRSLLRIPPGVTFEVLPRALASRSFGSRRREDRRDELVFRVRWEENETYDLGWSEPSIWAIAHGTTLVVVPESGEVLSCLTTDTNPERQKERGALLRRWAEDGTIQDTPLAAEGEQAAGPNRVAAIDGAARLRSSARALHMASKRNDTPGSDSTKSQT